MPSAKNLLLSALKIIGVLLFLWILSRIDRGEVVRQLRGVRMDFFLLSFALLIVFYVLKTVRWRMLLRLAGTPVTFRRAWRTYNIGTFLGIITPGSIGELGRAAYLRRDGLDPITALTVTIVDRCFDVAVVLILAIAALGILFGTQWLALALPVTVLAALLLWQAGHARSVRSTRPWITFLLTLLSRPRSSGSLLLLTALCWAVYCAWALLLASSLSLSAPLLPFLSAIILTGVLALLPIAPSGLGTRDAALVTFLRPYGIAAPNAVALAFLMFGSLLLSGGIGCWYWASPGKKQ